MNDRPEPQSDPRAHGAAPGLPVDEPCEHEHEELAAEPTLSFDSSGASSGTQQRGSDLVAVGGYRVVGRLGEGGMGTVFEAEQQSPHRRVALKVMHRGHRVDEVHARLFHHEAETLARLRHPSIAAIFESGHTADGHDFFAMELVPGPTLDVWLRARPRELDREALATRLHLMRAICDGVHYAHQRGVIHRDLKPTNIIVCDDGATDSRDDSLPPVKILDFGLARITDPGLEATTLVSEVGAIKGTLPYMSPEQALGDVAAVDVRTDVYALGVILYEMLTGCRPLDVRRSSLVDAVRTICETPPRPLRQAWAGPARLDSDLETIVATAIAKDPDRRYHSAAALADDIERYLTSQPVAARPPSRVYRAKKFVARHRVGVTAALLVVLALVLGIAGTTAGLIRARQAEARALQQAASSQRVAHFLADMLSSVDVHAVGSMITRELETQIADAARLRGASASQIESDLTAFRLTIRGVSGTDLGRKIVDFAILSPAGEGLRQRFVEEPEVGGELELTLAETYERLGMYEPAEQHARRAVELFATADPGSAESLRARSLTALVDYRLGRYEPAGIELSRALESQRRLLGADHHDTLQSGLWLSWLDLEGGRNDDAERRLEPIVEALTRTLGTDRQETLTAMNTLAVLRTNQGRLEEAETLHGEILERRSRLLGSDHPDTLKSMTNLAVVLFHQGRLEEAEALLGDVVARQRERFGPEHPETLRSMNNLAVVLERDGKLEAAEALHLEALTIKTRVLGADHPETLSSRYNFAVLQTALGRLDEAERLHAEVLSIRRRVLGESHPRTLDSTCALAGVAARAGDRDRALELLDEAISSGYRDAESLVRDPDFASLQGDPEFRRLVDRARSQGAASAL